jgi:hypothetical protein
MFYTLEDYTNINSIYTLPKPVLDIISDLSQRFGTTILSDNIVKIRGSRNSSYKQINNNSDESWKTTFKPTVLIESGGKINELRISLNKLSTKNYDSTCLFIIDKIKALESEEVVSFITIFKDTISVNQMFSNLYAKIYKIMIDVFPELFSDSLHLIISDYSDSISKIQMIDPNENYDNFCINNKENDKRKTIAKFITYAIDNDLIKIDFFFSIIDSLFDIVLSFIKEDDKTYQVEEITENIFILLTQQAKILSNLPTHIKEIIITLSAKSAKDHPSISSRSIFKYMDIVDMIKLI